MQPYRTGDPHPRKMAIGRLGQPPTASIFRSLCPWAWSFTAGARLFGNRAGKNEPSTKYGVPVSGQTGNAAQGEQNGEESQEAEIFEGSGQEGEARHEEAQIRHAQKRPLRQKGQEQEASHRYRTFRGAQERGQGSEETLEQEALKEKVLGKPIPEEPGRPPGRPPSNRPMIRPRSHQARPLGEAPAAPTNLHRMQ